MTIRPDEADNGGDGLPEDEASRESFPASDPPSSWAGLDHQPDSDPPI